MMRTTTRVLLIVERTIVDDIPGIDQRLPMRESGSESLTITEIDQRAIRYRDYEACDGEDPTGTPATVTEVLNYLTDRLQESLEFTQQQYRDAGGPA